MIEKKSAKQKRELLSKLVPGNVIVGTIYVVNEKHVYFEYVLGINSGKYFAYSVADKKFFEESLEEQVTLFDDIKVLA